MRWGSKVVETVAAWEADHVHGRHGSHALYS